MHAVELRDVGPVTEPGDGESGGYRPQWPMFSSERNGDARKPDRVLIASSGQRGNVEPEANHSNHRRSDGGCGRPGARKRYTGVGGRSRHRPVSRYFPGIGRNDHLHPLWRIYRQLLGAPAGRVTRRRRHYHAFPLRGTPSRVPTGAAGRGDGRHRQRPRALELSRSFLLVPLVRSRRQSTNRPRTRSVSGLGHLFGGRAHAKRRPPHHGQPGHRRTQTARRNSQPLLVVA